MRRGWSWFRSWPTWAQATAWIVAAVMIVSTLADEGDDEVVSAQPAVHATSTLPGPASTGSTTSTTESIAPTTTSTVVATTTTTPDLLPPAPPAADVVPLDLLGQLIVAPEAESATYDRDRFSHWIDADGNGCHTRCEVLAEERLDSLPGLAGGGWLSTYDGYSTDDASELEVDHVVALSEAWRSGAWSWSDARRRDFANDLDHPGALTAVTAATNRSKSDRDPSSWQPPNREAWCGYASDWVSTKVRWGLSADDAEVRALTNMLNGCGPVLRAVPPMLPAPAPAPTPTLDAPPAAGGCHPSYPEVCIPPAPPDLDCGDVSHRRFAVVGDDPHRFDGNDDGVGCES